MARYYRTFGRSFRYRVLLYFYRNRKRSIDVREIVRVFKLTQEESVRLLRQLQENMMLRDIGGGFILSNNTKTAFDVIRNGAIVLTIMAILWLYTIIIRSLGIGRY